MIRWEDKSHFGGKGNTSNPKGASGSKKSVASKIESKPKTKNQPKKKIHPTGSHELHEAHQARDLKKKNELCVKMIKETEQFLNKAEGTTSPLPVIPTRKANEGGFEFINERPGAKAMATAWWHRALNLIARYD